MNLTKDKIKGVRKPDLAELLQRGFRYSLALSNDRTKAEDLLQEACLRVHRINGPWQFPYLVSVIKNCYIDMYRRTKLHKTINIDEVGESRIKNGRMKQEDHQDKIIFKNILENALEKLTPNEREVVFMSVVEGVTTSEIAKIIHKPKGTILSLLHRGKQKIRTFLESKQWGDLR